MQDDRYSDEFEKAAAGLDFDEDSFHERAASIGAQLAEGPEALLEEIENLLPESWREQIRTFPIAAIALGVGIGIFLGYKKGTEVIAAGSAMLTAAATSNLNEVLSRAGRG